MGRALRRRRGTTRSRMAKGNKHSPALFEVVHGKRHFDKIARDSALRTPSWWFKGRKRMAESGALAPAVTSTAVEDAPPFTDSEPPPSLADPTQNPSILVNRELPRDDSDGAGSVDPMAVPEALTATSRSRRTAPFQFVVDRDRHELFVRVRYTTAAVAGVSIVMLVALAYLTGRHTGRFPSSAIASASSEQIAAGPVEKGVLDLNPRAGNAASATTGPAFMNTGAGGGVTRAPSPRTATQPSATQPGRPGA